MQKFRRLTCPEMDRNVHRAKISFQIWLTPKPCSFHYMKLLLFSRSVVSNSLWPHRQQHARLPHPSPTPGACSNSCHPTVSCSVIRFSSWLQSFPASGSFLMSWLFVSGGQSNGAFTSASVLPMYIQDWSPLGWTGWISLQSKGLSRVFSNTTVQKHQFFGSSAFFMAQLSHLYMTTGKSIALTRLTFVGKVMPQLFNMLSRFVIAFLPQSKHLLISWMQSPSAVILEPRKIKSLNISIVSPSTCHEVIGLDAMIFVFWMLSLSQPFHSPLSPSSRSLLVPLRLLP